MRRADRTGRQNHLAAATRAAQGPVLPPAHAGGAAAREFQALDQTAGFEPEVFPMQHWLEKAARGGPAPAKLLVDVEIADAFVVAGVEIVHRRNAILDRCGAEGVENFP